LLFTYRSNKQPFDNNQQEKMRHLTLVVMAAGTGTRYGGPKQLDPVGPSGETIIHYSVFDAVRAGFTKVVFVIRHDIEKRFREAISYRLEGKIQVEHVFQDQDCLPGGLSFSTKRQKPWGTAHAILVAAETIHEPFAVINGDDFYGLNSFRILAGHLGSKGTDHAMVGFVLRNTLSDFGPVKRGVCQLTTEGFLQSVTELEEIKREGEIATYRDRTGAVQHLTGDELVSMNMWAFRLTLFPYLRKQWTEFVRKRADDQAAEFYIPDVVTALIQDGKAKCSVLRTSDAWFGVTYREDRPVVINKIHNLITRGDYPERLTFIGGGCADE
jgi:dTDP-glucose pyrophosphorylase